MLAKGAKSDRKEMKPMYFYLGGFMTMNRDEYYINVYIVLYTYLYRYS
jgi:hypothetical protein